MTGLFTIRSRPARMPGTSCNPAAGRKVPPLFTKLVRVLRTIGPMLIALHLLMLTLLSWA